MSFNMRTDGRVEWVCKHGIGHTIDAPEDYKKNSGKWWISHCCDGCCNEMNIPLMKGDMELGSIDRVYMDGNIEMSIHLDIKTGDIIKNSKKIEFQRDHFEVIP